MTQESDDEAFRERQRKRAENAGIEPTGEFLAGPQPPRAETDEEETPKRWLVIGPTSEPAATPASEAVEPNDAPSEPPAEGDLVVSLGDADPLEILRHLVQGGARNRP